MKKTLLLLAASVACAFPALAQKTYTLTSPDGRLRTTVAAGDALTYAVTLDGRPILDASPLSLTLDNGTTWGIAPRVTGVSRTSVDTAIPSPFYRSAEVRDRYNGLTLKMRGDWSVEFRAYDDGVAYRFVSRAEKPFNIVSEQAEYRFPADCAVTVPYVRDHAGNIDAQWRNSFENTYTETTLSKLDAGRLIFLPLVVDAGDGVKVCITETDLNDYPGMYLWNGDGGQHLNGAGRMIQRAPAVVGHHDAVAPGAFGGDGVRRRHHALEDEFHAESVYPVRNRRQLGGRLRRHGAAHAGQRDQTGRVDVHQQHAGSGFGGAAELPFQFFAAPRLDAGDAPARFGGDGGVSGLVQFVRSAVAGTADNAPGPAAGDDGLRVLRFRQAAAHVEGGSPDGCGQHGQTQIEAEHVGFRDRLLHVVDEAHVQTHGGERRHVVPEGAPGSDAAHAGRFPGAGPAVANRTDPAVPFHALPGPSPDFLDIHT